MSAITLPSLPALVPGVVRHARSGPKGHRFAHGTYQWLVDLDELPVVSPALGWAAVFRAADHLGAPDLPIKHNVVEFVRAQGGSADEIARVVMLAHARTAGHVFNPLSVHWCLDAENRPVAVVAEVHNTYGERHAYLLRPDEAGRSTAAKEFYVSPFNEISGSYRIRTTLTENDVRVTITTEGTGAPRFAASFAGRAQPYTPARLLRLILRRPLVTLQTSAWIRIHGIWLWARGHRIVPRPAHQPPQGV